MTPLKRNGFTTYPVSLFYQWKNSFSKKDQNLPLLKPPPIIDYIAATKHICDSLGENTPSIKTEYGKYNTKVNNVLDKSTAILIQSTKIQYYQGMKRRPYAISEEGQSSHGQLLQTKV